MNPLSRWIKPFFHIFFIAAFTVVLVLARKLFGKSKSLDYGLIIGFVLIFIFYEFYLEPRWQKKEISQQVSKTLDRARRGKQPYQAANPDYEVRYTADEIQLKFPKETSPRILLWKDLEVVMIKTTDQGPFVPDCFWILKTSHRTEVFPMHSVGDPEFLKRLGELPRFDPIKVVQAMGSAKNAEFLCWRKSVT